MSAAARSPSIVFENVSFRYSEHGEWIVRVIDISIAPGEWISIVGGYGSGKSTFVKLVNGLLTAGTVGVTAEEDIAFGVTTGSLGLALGFSIAHSKNRIQVVLFAALALWAGIAMVLYAFRFPLLGPSVPQSFDIASVMYIFLFSLLYSAIWTELSLRLLARLRKSAHGL
ncbi:ATP-binding cassette domain-containing protein [Paenibacillus sp. HJGM_3]|uniref:ATP-binding cassette domain-containing protein n=1 Tax=Paenibacillus sp. HJGM_3 TaxID=3379816 RepID=UPI00385A1492